MRLIDADALLKHEIESDRIRGVLLCVTKGHILRELEVSHQCPNCGYELTRRGGKEDGK